MNKKLLNKISPVFSKIRNYLSTTVKLIDSFSGSNNNQEIVEVEDKYLVQDTKYLTNQLLSQGFKLSQDYIQEDIYFDIQDKLRKIDQNIRLRRILGKNGEFREGEIKWEGPRGRLEDRPVVEIKIDCENDFQQISDYLKNKLGLQEFCHLFKNRKLYQLMRKGQKIQIELDNFPNLKNSPNIRGKNYLQVALEVKPKEATQAKKTVQIMAHELGLNNRDNRDYLEIAQGLERKKLKRNNKVYG